MTVFTVEDPVFQTEPLFVLGCSQRDLVAYLRRRFPRLVIDPDDDQVTGTMWVFNGPPWRLVWVRDRDDLPTALHEVFHLATRICHDKGIPIRARDERGDVGDEAAAYLFTFFARQVLRRFPAGRRRARH